MIVRIYAMLAFASFCIAMVWQPPMVRYAESMGDYVAEAYRHVIGDLDGRACPSYPVCSQYARQAMERYGLLLGSWMALDRLIHEGGDLETGTFVRIDGRLRLYDTLERNTFWIGGQDDQNG